MTIRQQCGLAALLLASIPAGCVRTAEGPQEEQRNPFYLAGKERLQAMDYAGATESFERALQENPKSVLAHFELGVVYETQLADYPAALYHYNKALKLRPTGYPADNIRFRIPACRQELVKADSLAVLNPSALREMERLRDENRELRRQLGDLRARVAQPAPAPAAAPAPVTARGLTNSTPGGSPLISGRFPPPAPGPGAAGRPAAGASDAVRLHAVRASETLASISRSYNVRLEAILAANRGLDPRHLKVGQTVKVPQR